MKILDYPDIHIYTSIFGSRLYGTDNENSDMDIKSIVVPNPIHLILGQKIKESSTIHVNNGIVSDIEIYTLHKFLKLASEGQTVAMDMLFSNQIDTGNSDIWDKYIVPIREKFVTKKLMSFIGYATSQATKYSNKGKKIENYTNALNFFKQFNKGKTICEKMENMPKFFEYELIKKSETETNIKIDDIELPLNAQIKFALNALEGKLEKYGVRAKQAFTDGGIDYKAISHAYRTMKEVEELLDTGKIEFPLKYADEIKKIKYHKITSVDYVLKDIKSNCDFLAEKIKKSNLPNEVDSDLINDIILSIYDELYGISNLNYTYFVDLKKGDTIDTFNR